jgi:membrane protein implicated in regulation of membrane protease activity
MKSRTLAIAAALATVGFTTAAEAYVGPGAALGLLSAFWALLVAVGAVLAFVLAWPLRRMLKRRRSERLARAEREERAGKPVAASPTSRG